tara:strand:+ start:2830 stop:3402 length:573 start_codon:yes stop_codon:yes gene_type:complete
MDFDFIVTCIVYLALILFIHMSLKDDEPKRKVTSIINKSKNTNKEPQDKSPKSEPEVEEDTAPIEIVQDTPDDTELIINENELKNINQDMQNNDFIKYLDVEGADADSSYQQLVSPLQENTIDITENDSKSDLDKYFTNIKEEQYNFNPVPTNKEQNTQDIYSDVKSLNIDDNAKNVMAFDEFNPSYANL